MAIPRREAREPCRTMLRLHRAPGKFEIVM
jgi:hypothetical protein